MAKKVHTPEILNTPDSPKWQQREFPKWDRARSTSGGVMSFFLGLLVWILLIIVFIIGLFVTLICRSLDAIINAFVKKPIRTPWLIGLVLVFFFPLNVVIVMIGWLVMALRG